MIEKVSFTSNSQAVRRTDYNTAPVSNKKENKNSNSNQKLLIASLSLLGIAGAAYLLLKKPAAAKGAVEDAAEEVLDTAKKARTKVKGRIKRKEELAIAGREKSMDKADAKWQRKNERKLVEKQRKFEEEAHFTPEELEAYGKEYGYQRPSVQRQQKIKELNEQNAAEREVKNSIGETAKKTEPKKSKPQISPAIAEQRSLEGSIKDLERKIAGSKRFGKNTAKLEQQLKDLKLKLMNVTVDDIAASASK